MIIVLLEFMIFCVIVCVVFIAIPMYIIAPIPRKGRYRIVKKYIGCERYKYIVEQQYWDFSWNAISDECFFDYERAMYEMMESIKSDNINFDEYTLIKKK